MEFIFSGRNSGWISDIVQLRKVFFPKDNLKINKNVHVLSKKLQETIFEKYIDVI